MYADNLSAQTGELMYLTTAFYTSYLSSLNLPDYCLKLLLLEDCTILATLVFTHRWNDTSLDPNDTNYMYNSPNHHISKKTSYFLHPKIPLIWLCAITPNPTILTYRVATKSRFSEDQFFFRLLSNK